MNGLFGLSGLGGFGAFGIGSGESVNPSSGQTSAQSESLKRIAEVFFPRNKLDEIFNEDKINMMYEDNKAVSESRNKMAAWHTVA